MTYEYITIPPPPTTITTIIIGINTSMELMIPLGEILQYFSFL
jgi:hypothetical protein